MFYFHFILNRRLKKQNIRPDRSSVLYLVVMFILFFVFPLLSEPVEKKSDDTNDKPTLKECDELYAKQLQLASSDSLLAPALKKTGSALLSSNVIDDQRAKCRSGINRVNFQCQMNAKSFLEMEECNLKFKGGSAHWTIGGSSQNTPWTSPDDDPEKLKLIGSDLTEESCTKIYDSMLKIYDTDKQVHETDWGKKMILQWKTKKERDDFNKQCRTRFRSADVSCIFSANNRDDLQKCLKVIP